MTFAAAAVAPPEPAVDPSNPDRPTAPAGADLVAALALPGDDAVELLARFEKLETEMKPKSELARMLVFRVFLMRQRLARAARQEAATLSYLARRARSEFEEARLAEVDHLISWIAKEPTTNARLLRKTPEGCDRLLLHLEGLRHELARPEGHRWGIDHCDYLLLLLGGRYSDLPVHRPRALTHAIDGEFQYLDDSDGEGLDRDERRRWAVGELLALVDRKIADVKALLEGLDLEGFDRDREEAAARAMFDASKEAVLARKYEAACERSLFRALREFREAQAEAEVAKGSGVGASLGSFFPRPSGASKRSASVNSTDPSRRAGRDGASAHPPQPTADDRERRRRRPKPR